MAAGPRARISVPGKVILMGEHAAVYGHPAVAAAAGMRLRAAITLRPHASIDIEIPGLRLAWQTDWQAVAQAAEGARVAWQAYTEDPTPARFAALRPDSAGGLVTLALGEAVRVVAATRDLPGMHLLVESEIPVGAGFGSSAAAALAIVAGVVGVLEGEIDWTLVNRAVLEVERRQHGSPSGVDAATVYHGGVLRARRLDGSLELEPLAARPDLLAAVHLYSTGSPAESTGEVVAAVRTRHDANQTAFGATLGRMRAQTERLTGILAHARTTVADLLEPIREYHRCLCELGVVPAEVRVLVARVEQAGGAAKISGAGSLAGPGAGSLLSIHPDPGYSEPALQELLVYPVALGVEGVRVETLAVAS